MVCVKIFQMEASLHTRSVLEGILSRNVGDRRSWEKKSLDADICAGDDSDTGCHAVGDCIYKIKFICFVVLAKCKQWQKAQAYS